MTQKLVIIMRGLPGSGKSHWVEQFVANLPLAEALRLRQSGIFSTDRFFYQGEEYCFDANKLAEYHQRNLTAFIQALSCAVPIVICDNTNLCRWEYMAYEAAAKAIGYQVRVMLVGDPLDVNHQMQCAERNRHQVSLRQIQRMAQLFEVF